MLFNDEEFIKESKEDIKRSIKTICEACTPISKKDFKEKYGIIDIEEKARDLQLDISDEHPFAICPVFFL